MFINQITKWVLAIVFAGLTQASFASSSAEAFSACKKYVSALHEGDFRAKLKKVRRRSGNTKVSMRATVNGERFKATCLISKSGDISYTNSLGENSNNAIAENSSKAK